MKITFTNIQLINLRRIYFLLFFEFLLIVFLSFFSQPLREIGFTSWLPLKLQAFGKTGRVIFVYHSLAVPFVIALLYIYFLIFDIKGDQIAQLATPGSVLTSAGGLGFAYLYRSWIFHGVFIFGLSLVFFAGLLFLKELFSSLKIQTQSIFTAGVFSKEFSLENLAYFLTTLFVLVSVVIGAAVASYFGNGFKAFLAEDVLRASHDIFQRAIIAHLHVLLALIDVFLLLLIASAFKMPEKLKKVFLWLVLVGTVIVAFGAWSVIIWEKIAHKIINIGSAFLLLPAIILAAKGLRDKWQDAPWLGVFFYLIAVNLFVTAPGVYVAVNLEKFRSLPYEVERTFAVGHWHVLATITAVVAFLLLVALSLKGKARQPVGYLVAFGSVLAFSGAFFYQFYQKTYLSMRFIESGIFLILAAVVIYLWIAPQIWKVR